LNIAGAIAGSFSPDRSSLDIERLSTHLRDLGADTAWLLGDQPEGLEPTISILRLLVGVQSLGAMRESGRAGLLRFSERELEQALADTPSAPDRPAGRWMEFARLPDGDWVAYPQDDDASHPRIVLWLPVASGPAVTRLLALDSGIDATSGEVERPYANVSGCDPGFAGWGRDLRQVCLPGTCPHRCSENWQYRQGDSVLVSCGC
jgi:hypothetical protein